MSTQPWIPAVTGMPIDLVEPRVDQVDFRAMAHALANANRYAGHGERQVSIARHLLIGLDLCPEAIKPWWLLHDSHEERLGEITTPALKALAQIADHLNPMGRTLIEDTVAEFKARHDAAIHAAAGLPLPTAAQRAVIRQVDAQCVPTEHRDFHRPSTRRWHHEEAGILPGRQITRWASPEKTAEQLLARFERHLPALRAAAA